MASIRIGSNRESAKGTRERLVSKPPTLRLLSKPVGTPFQKSEGANGSRERLIPKPGPPPSSGISMADLNRICRLNNERNMKRVPKGQRKIPDSGRFTYSHDSDYMEATLRKMHYADTPFGKPPPRADGRRERLIPKPGQNDHEFMKSFIDHSALSSSMEKLKRFLAMENSLCNSRNDCFTDISEEDIDEGIRAPNKCLGEGGEGCVYKIIVKGMPLAVKIKNETGPFNREVRLLKKIQHPNVVKFVKAFNNRRAIVSEFLPNGNLREMLQQKNPIIPLAERLACAWGISAALVELHNMKPDPIAHGDLKPENVVFDSHFICKLIDFGNSFEMEFAELVDQPAHVAQNFRGTTYYEDKLAMKEQKVTRESDIFAFGIILLELLTGMEPIQLNEVRDIWNKTTNKVVAKQQISANIVKSVELRNEFDSWPSDTIISITELGLRCCDPTLIYRPKAAAVWTAITELGDFEV